MELNTYPNNFKTDAIYEDKPLLYNFDSTYDLTPTTTKTILNADYLYKTGGNQKMNNIKFNDKTYYFNGLILTKNKDLIDDVVDYQYILYIEGIDTLNYIYIGIPVKLETETSNNTNEIDAIQLLFEEDETDTVNISSDLINELMPINEYYYDYKTDKIFNTNKFTPVILFKNSTLKTKYNNTSLKINKTTNVNIPLVRSKDYCYQSSYISPNIGSNKIYIDCQPVELLGEENEIQVSGINSYDKVYQFMELGIGFILIFIILKIILNFQKSNKNQ